MGRRKSSGRLGTRLRGKLAEAYGQRGHQKAGLWYVYSPRTDRDWVIRSDLHYDHFVWTEADADVVDVDYAPTLSFPELDGLPLAAIVQYGGGMMQWHQLTNASEIRSTQSSDLIAGAAKHAGARLRLVDQEEIYRNQQWLWNWKRVIAWMAAARGTTLVPFTNQIAAFIDRRGSATLGEVAQLGSDESFPLFAAAVFRLVQRGALQSNLDEHPLSMFTEFVTRRSP